MHELDKTLTQPLQLGQERDEDPVFVATEMMREEQSAAFAEARAWLGWLSALGVLSGGRRGRVTGALSTTSR